MTGMNDTAAIAAAYDASSAAWADGPERLYAELADLLISASPVPLHDLCVLDVGAGTGVVSRAASVAGARVLAVDVALGMLRVRRSDRPPAVGGDATRLPVRGGAVDMVLAGFCLNHIDPPLAALTEWRRVTRPDGVVLASVFALGEDHPAKVAVEEVLTAHGWTRPQWYDSMRSIESGVGSPDALSRVAERARLVDVTVMSRRVATGLTDPMHIAGYRLGMAHTAPFIAALPQAQRAALLSDVVTRLRDGGEPVRPDILLLSGRTPTAR